MEAKMCLSPRLFYKTEFIGTKPEAAAAAIWFHQQE